MNVKIFLNQANKILDCYW